MKLLDTNVLLDYSELIFKNNQEKFIIHTVVLEELDNIIHNSLSDEKKYKARQARNKIKGAHTKKLIEYSTHSPTFTLPTGWDYNKNDNTLLKICKDLEYCLITNDLAMQIKADAIKVKWEEFNVSKQEYSGFIYINENEFSTIFEELNNGINSLGLLENQYLIVKKDEHNSSEYRYSNGKLKRLKLPDLKGLKPKNSVQRCALDLLLSTEIPVKILAGLPGSGKTRLATELALYHVFDRGNYGSIMFLRNPLGSGEEIGFLTGDKQSKIGDFFRCVQQYIDPSVYRGKDIKNYIEQDVPFYIKGISYGSKYVLVDEAEDMDLKTLRLIGTRIESDSCVVFCGDWKQAENKFSKNNGLYQLVDKIKGSPLVGIIVLDKDVRSEASKIFANL